MTETQAERAWFPLPNELASPAPGPRVVLGVPGSGKTELALSLLVDRLKSGFTAESCLLLVPSRTEANRVRDELSLRSGITFSAPVIRTFSAYAFDVLARARAAEVLPGVETRPRLLSGAEQDTLIENLLAGHKSDGLGPAWPEALGEAPHTRGFRDEIRALMDRTEECGASPEEVRSAGLRHAVPEWEAAADFIQEFNEVASLAHAEAFAPAELIARAVDVLNADTVFAQEERTRLRLVIVDDVQEATPSQHRLVRTLVDHVPNRRSATTVMMASPDTVVQGFRGARPDLVDQLIQLAERAHGASGVLTLGTQTTSEETATRPLSHRMAPGIANVYQRIVHRLPAHGGSSLRQAPRIGEDAAVDIGLVATDAQQDRLISRHVLEAHIRDGVAYQDIAVIVRNGGLVQHVSRALGLDGISTEIPPVEVALREEAAVRPLLEMARWAMGPPAQGPTSGTREAQREHSRRAARVERLLLGPYGGVSSLDIRRLRQDLLAHDRLRLAQIYGVDAVRAGEAPVRSSDALLGDLMDEDYAEADYESWGAGGYAALRLRGMIDAARTHMDGYSTPSTVMWALWEHARMADSWRKLAVNHVGLLSDRANRDLDAVMALFQAAERFSEQVPGAGVGRFIENLESHDVPMDSLAQRGSSAGRVRVLTPAAAAGQEFDTVVIAGLQEGVWPSTGLRGELLRSQDLAAIFEYGDQAATGFNAVDQLRAVRADELRQLAMAVSRARRKLHVTAVADDDALPSTFLDILRGPHADPLTVTEVPRPATLTTLTALLRRVVEAGETPEQIDDAARILAALATADPPVQGAAPSQWWGVAPLSSQDPVVPVNSTVKVSGSKVESVLESPQSWFMGASGGVKQTDFARSLGTLIHAIAERFPEANMESMLRDLASHWSMMPVESEWEDLRERAKAQTMLERFAQYVHNQPSASVSQETGFRVPLPPEKEVAVGASKSRPIDVSGSIDRVELTEDGRPIIVDLKTGKYIPSAASMEENAQLVTYQVAVRYGALEHVEEIAVHQRCAPAGARIVALGYGKSSKATVRAQASIEEYNEGAEAERQVREAAALMSAADFIARHTPGGFDCTNPGTCPLCAAGKQVTHP